MNKKLIIEKMKVILLITLLSTLVFSCQECDYNQLNGEQENMLLDSLQKKYVKTGCDECDKQIQEININAALEKLNTEFRIARGSYGYNQIVSSLSDLKYYKIDRKDLAFNMSSRFRDSLTITQLNDSIKISFFQEILGGCSNYIPKLIINEDSLIIQKITIPDLNISCHSSRMDFDFAYYMCIDVTESIILINRDLLKNKKLFFQPYKDLMFSIPFNKDTILPGKLPT